MIIIDGCLKNITKKIAQIFFVASILQLLLFSSFLSQTHAKNTSFEKTAYLQYAFDKDAENNVPVTIFLNIKNISSQKQVIKYFTVTVPFKTITDLKITKDNNTGLRGQKYRNKEIYDIVIDLQNTVIQRDQSISLKLTFTTKDVYASMYDTTKYFRFSGYLPGINTKSVNIKYPTYWGDVKYSSNKVLSIKKEAGFSTISLKPSNNFAVLLLGNILAYDFVFSKQVYNNDVQNIRVVDIPLPKEYSKQKIIISHVEPFPDTAYKDTDGNIFLKYIIKPQSTLDLTIQGQIVLNDNQIVSDIGDFTVNTTAEKQYWYLDNLASRESVFSYLERQGISRTAIYAKISKPAKRNLVEKIQQFVVSTLKPDTKLRLTSNESYVREGASSVIGKHFGVNAEDYADLTIAIMRLYGIPARMVEGVVLSDNPDDTVQYHFSSWVEYINEDNEWEVLDPFLVDLDGRYKNRYAKSRHITLITRSYNPIKPVLGFFSQENFVISLSRTRFDSINTFETSITPNGNSIYTLTIENTGNNLQIGPQLEMENLEPLRAVSSERILLPGDKLTIKLVSIQDHTAGTSQTGTIKTTMRGVSDPLLTTHTQLDSVSINQISNNSRTELNNIFVYLFLALLYTMMVYIVFKISIKIKK